MLIFGVLCASLLCAWLLVPVAIRIGQARQMVDPVGRVRTIHTVAVPRTGGIIVGLTVLAAVAGGLGLLGDLRGSPLLWAILVGGACAFAVGLLDDTHSLRARHKLLGQVLAACLVCAAGFRIDHVALVTSWDLGAFGDLLTVVWLVATMNAMNLIDGMDGLAGGLAACCAGATGLIAYSRGDVPTQLVSAAVVGGCLGFLRFNFHPAKVFLGDSGSLFLGLVLGVLALQSGRGTNGIFTVGGPVLLLCIPLVDTTLAIVRRLALGYPISGGDADHVHHRLLKRGLTQRQAAVLMYMLCISASLFAVVYSRSSGPDRMLLLASAAMISLGGLVLLGYLSLARASWLDLVDRRRRNRALRRAVRELKTEVALHGLDARFERVAARLGPIIGATRMELEAGSGSYAWVAGSVDGAGREHRFPAQVRGLLPGTLSLSLGADKPPDLALVVEGICGLLSTVQASARPMPAQPRKPPAPVASLHSDAS